VLRHTGLRKYPVLNALYGLYLGEHGHVKEIGQVHSAVKDSHSPIAFIPLIMYASMYEKKSFYWQNLVSFD
jgi:hypothetical protein